MTHNGYLIHPDMWMLWFSFFVSVATTFTASAALFYLVVRRKK